MQNLEKKWVFEEPNKRHVALIKLINEHGPLDIREICEYLPEYYKIHVTKGNYTNCPRIYQDIKEITDNLDYYGKMLIVRNGLVFFGTKEDVMSYYSREIAKLKTQVRKCRAIETRMKLDGSLDIFEDVVYKAFVEEADDYILTKPSKI